MKLSNLIENSNKPIHVTLNHAVRINGVYISIDAPEEWITGEMEEVFDQIGDTFPELLDDDFSDNDEERNEFLINKATEMLRPLIPNVVVNFREDHYMS